MAKFIARTVDGAEYIYSGPSMHSVPARSAKEICALLNEARYKLTRPGEKWHVYEMAGYGSECTAAKWQKFTLRNGRLIEIIT